MDNILEKLDVNLTTLELRSRFSQKPHDFEKERELRLSAKEIKYKDPKKKLKMITMNY